jgi:hypothetical protein
MMTRAGRNNHRRCATGYFPKLDAMTAKIIEADTAKVILFFRYSEIIKPGSAKIKYKEALGPSISNVRLVFSSTFSILKGKKVN